MTELVKYEAARRALAEVASVDEAKNILDKVAALQAYAKQANDTDMEVWLSEVKLRARRKIGELTRELDKAPGARTDKEPRSSGETKSAALKSAGISKSLANRCEQVASIPEKVFEEVIEQKKKRHQPVFYADIERKVTKSAKRTEKAERKLPPSEIRRQFDVRVSDVGDLSWIDDGAVDCIITDPPYPKEYLPVYELLSRTAARVLKPGGSCIVMVGQSYLPRIIEALSTHLEYHWTLAYLTPGGQSAQLWDRNVNTFWKPLLWFVNGEYCGDWIGDVSKSNPNDNDKRFHHWGQSESGMADIVNRFTNRNDIVLDPFCGGGTTGIVTSDLGRFFLGADIDEQCVNDTVKRLGDPNAEMVE